MLASPSVEEEEVGGLVGGLLTIVAKVWDEDEEEEVEAEEDDAGASSLASLTLEEDSGRQHEEDEVAGWSGGSGGCDCGGGGGSGGCAGVETMEEALFELLSLAESLQAHWHWQDSSCLMMMTGRLSPICCTELPAKWDAPFKVNKNKMGKAGLPKSLCNPL